MALWLSITFPGFTALLLPCMLVRPVGPWRWIMGCDTGWYNQADVASTVTHQTMKRAGRMETYNRSVDAAVAADAGGATPASCLAGASSEEGEAALRERREGSLSALLTQRKVHAARTGPTTEAERREMRRNTATAVLSVHSGRFSPVHWVNSRDLLEAVRDPNSGETSYVNQARGTWRIVVPVSAH